MAKYLDKKSGKHSKKKTVKSANKKNIFIRIKESFLKMK